MYFVALFVLLPSEEKKNSKYGDNFFQFLKNLSENFPKLNSIPKFIFLNFVKIITSDYVTVEQESDDKGPKVDNVQKKLLAAAGQDVDAYMKEMEEVHKKTEAEKAADLRNRMARVTDQPMPPGEAPQTFVQVAPGGFMMRPPQLRPGMPPPG